MWGKFDKAMKARNMTQSQIEDKLGLATGRISKWRSNPRTLSIEDAVKLARYVGLNLAYWLDDAMDEPIVAGKYSSDHESLIGAYEGLGLELKEAVRRLALVQQKIGGFGQGDTRGGGG